MYAAFGRGGVAGVLAHLTGDVVWAFEANSVISWGGIRRGPQGSRGILRRNREGSG
jgi:ketosteroid isomerase-like protein